MTLDCIYDFGRKINIGLPDTTWLPRPSNECWLLPGVHIKPLVSVKTGLVQTHKKVF